MEENAPIESGLGSFAKSFGDTVAKGSQNEQKQAFKAWLDQRNNTERTKGRVDVKKTVPGVNPLSHSGKGDPQLMAGRRALTAVQKLEDHLQKFGDTISNPMNVNNNPITVEHYRQYYKEALASGKDTGAAMNIAKQKVFKDAYPDEAASIYKAHASGTVAHILQNYPELSQDFPTIALKYNIQPPAAPAQPAPGNGAPAAPAQAPPPGPQSMGPKPPVAPQQTAMAPKPPQAPPAQPPPQMAQMKMPPVGNIPVGPQSAPNTMIPGQGPAGSQNEEELDNTPEIG